MINLDGEEIVEVKEEKFKMSSISPFDFVNSIHYSKDNLIVDEWSEKQYNPFIINKSLSFGSDTVIQANEMNSRPHLQKKMQYDFLRNSIRPRKRFNKWIKSEKSEKIMLIQQYYKYNTDKACQVADLISDEQLNTIKNKMFTGGLTNETRSN
jgi:hypothetical protein